MLLAVSPEGDINGLIWTHLNSLKYTAAAQVYKVAVIVAGPDGD